MVTELKSDLNFLSNAALCRFWRDLNSFDYLSGISMETFKGTRYKINILMNFIDLVTFEEIYLQFLLSAYSKCLYGSGTGSKSTQMLVDVDFCWQF